MALPWGAFLFCTCACSLLQLGPVEASEAGGLDWDCEEDAEELTAPEELSEAQGLEDNDVIPARPPGADEAEIRIPSTEDSQSENNLLQEPPSPPDGQMDLDNECVFPFTFGNEKHFDCVDHPLLYSWCSLSEIYNGKWKYCTDDDRARCVFPFTYKGHVFNSCITLGSVFRMAWCSLSPNYDQDHAWKYCY